MLSHLKAVECQKWHFNCFQVGCFVKHKLETCYTHKVWIHNSAAVCIFRYVQWDVMLMKHQSHTWILWGVFGEKKRLRAVFLSPLKELFFFIIIFCFCCVCTFSEECVGFLTATVGVGLVYTPSLLMLSLLVVEKRCLNSWILKI